MSKRPKNWTPTHTERMKKLIMDRYEETPDEEPIEPTTEDWADKWAKDNE